MLFARSCLRTFLLTVLVLLTVACFTHTNFSNESAEEIYPGYRWQKIGNDVYLHSRNDPFDGPVDGNSVVIINRSGVIVIDTHINPAAARAVVEKIREITTQPVTHVVNTHWHDDHTNGNYVYREAFPHCKIMAHSETLKKLKQEWPAQIELRRKSYASLTQEQVLAAAEKLQASDAMKAQTYRVFAGYIEALKPELNSLEPVYPDTLVDEKLVIDEQGRPVVLQWMGAGNTAGDLVAWLPNDKIVVTGDLLVAPIPYAFDSPMLAWKKTLTEIRQLPAKTIVPGHGKPMADFRYLDQVLNLLDETVNKVREAAAHGRSLDDLSSSVDLGLQQQLFTNGDVIYRHAWKTNYIDPGLKSAWTSLGFVLPE